MFKLFDVFKIDSVGDHVWVAAADTLEEATAKVKVARKSDPHCEFCVVNQNTGATLTIPHNSPGE